MAQPPCTAEAPAGHRPQPPSDQHGASRTEGTDRMESQDRNAADATALPRQRVVRGNGGLWEARMMQSAWHFFTLTRLALVLLLLIASLVFIGTLIDQVPATVHADNGAYAQWLQRAETKYGQPWTRIFDKLQLFNVYRSLYFRDLLGLLTINIVGCSLNRWKPIWNTTFHTRIRMSEAFFQHSGLNARFDTALPPGEAAQLVRQALGRRRYHIKTDVDHSSIAIFADRNRLTRFATFFSHLSLVLLLGGTILGGVLGFKDDEFIVAEGATRPLGLGTGLAVRLDHFADEYWIEGPPKDYRSDLVLFDNGREVKSATIRVNSPLRYKGISFHQAFFGQTAIVKAQDKSGQVIFEDSVPLAWQAAEGNRTLGRFVLPKEGLEVYVIGPPSGENDPLIPAGTMRLELYRENARVGAPDNLSQGTPKEMAGLTFTFERESRFAGLKVVKDPGVNIVWTASGLMVFGIVVLFWFPRRRLWALCKVQAGGTTAVYLGSPTQRDLGAGNEFNRIRECVARSLGSGAATELAQERDRNV